MPTAAQVREYLLRYLASHQADLTANQEHAFTVVRDVLYDQEELEEA